MLAGFGEDYGLDQHTAITIARGFGAGMGLGSVCGAVTGATMVLGFKFGEEVNERDARYKTYEKIREFVRRFEDRRGTIMCKELLKGVDLATQEGRKKAEEQKLFTTLCPGYVKDAAEILDDLL